MMIKADAPYTAVEPESFEYLDNGKVLASLKTSTGEREWYVISTREFVRSINLAVECVNRNLPAILRRTAF